MKKNSFWALPAYLWKRVTHQYAVPFNRKLRDSFWLLLLLIAAEYAQRNWDQATLTVVPTETGTGTITVYSNATATLKAGSLVVNNPDLITLLFSDPGGRASFFTLLVLAIFSMIVIIICPKLSDQHLFRKDISRSIRWMGSLVILDAVIFEFFAKRHINQLVVAITNNQYEWSKRGFNTMVLAEAYIGVVIFAAGVLYHKGVKMREEQDLTI